MYEGYITDVGGIKVGHSQNYEGMTGCTVIICEEGATGGIDVRGSAPGTRETDLFQSDKTVDRIHGIVLAGGSAFGLNAAGGVMDYLENKNIGFDVGITKVPIVPAAVIFDLIIGDYRVRPDCKMGYEASMSASESENRQGNVGCGTGATVGKILGPKNAMKSGVGSASVKVGTLVVSALVAVNSFGDIYDHRNHQQIAGVYDYEKNRLLNTVEIMKNNDRPLKFVGTNTTIGVIATNGMITKSQGNKIAQMGHNGFAKSINPIHTTNDGDTIFTLGTNQVQADVDLVGVLGQEVMSRAITNAVESSENYDGLISSKNISLR